MNGRWCNIEGKFFKIEETEWKKCKKNEDYFQIDGIPLVVSLIPINTAILNQKNTEIWVSKFGKEKEKEKEKEEENLDETETLKQFECNICFGIAETPTVLPCSHLFCYSCITQWLQIKQECPVCKEPFTISNIIPVSGRNYENTSNFQRRFLQRRRRHSHRNITSNTDNLTFSIGFGTLPSSVGILFDTISSINPRLSQHQIHKIYSRILIFMTLLIFLTLLSL
ncbi:hypothetical protein M0811_07417 [Anaeramoeba ignava]|uniref:RING-type E3 ubiquitin transferase n=1 Tax=Anaeramoeba ignava TaxID=1746090 RepID=A0A9Q0RCS4_ANAIG|nr:hypothetical protein M0811_07417 [Anaeramoeba ignava]